LIASPTNLTEGNCSLMTITQYPIQKTIYREFGSTSPVKVKRGGVLPNKSKQHYIKSHDTLLQYN